MQQPPQRGCNGRQHFLRCATILTCVRIGILHLTLEMDAGPHRPIDISRTPQGVFLHRRAEGAETVLTVAAVHGLLPDAEAAEDVIQQVVSADFTKDFCKFLQCGSEFH